ncbi:VOC family protein [Prosthecomicrobium pneumaticum]|uniref:Putative glyoxalase superfamily protein PhnB n=1 Tax=Prosthecomicrobium pneumaticum TaxID=81895 RepID=A0A7W9L3I6_9HYPH|nr:VOC family protein [Prosthecomicrobium pneumaticum]MBB5754554.1 putative glyoxalase superfamily protein PhnB [Prosthecomicrobium pneumaticum]
MVALPAQHSTVSVYILAYEAPRLLDFVAAVFGGAVVMRLDREDGTLMHASVRIGDSTLMIADGTPQWPSFPVWLHVYVDDVDATYALALEHGATSVDAPADKPDGDRRGGIKDPTGNTWWIATPAG